MALRPLLTALTSCLVVLLIAQTEAHARGPERVVAVVRTGDPVLLDLDLDVFLEPILATKLVVRVPDSEFREGFEACLESLEPEWLFEERECLLRAAEAVDARFVLELWSEEWSSGAQLRYVGWVPGVPGPAMGGFVGFDGVDISASLHELARFFVDWQVLPSCLGMRRLAPLPEPRPLPEQSSRALLAAAYQAFEQREPELYLEHLEAARMLVTDRDIGARIDTELALAYAARGSCAEARTALVDAERHGGIRSDKEVEEAEEVLTILCP